MDFNPYDMALQVTDGALGEGTYAEINKNHPDPGVQAAIKRAKLLMPNEFMKGYIRPPHITEKLVEAFRAALYARPTERAGQLIDNALVVYQRQVGSGNKVDLFSTYDEQLLLALMYRRDVLGDATKPDPDA